MSVPEGKIAARQAEGSQKWGLVCSRCFSFNSLFRFGKEIYFGWYTWLRASPIAGKTLNSLLPHSRSGRPRPRVSLCLSLSPFCCPCVSVVVSLYVPLCVCLWMCGMYVSIDIETFKNARNGNLSQTFQVISKMWRFNSWILETI